ncbi:putative damage-inducible protein DinB [Kroppenstedtia sanguinis]|uniref:hypothetical protein n=1 Tax=Kroppenstedtia sanguinis TaxID=1380684 RepID=UPI003D25CFCA
MQLKKIRRSLFSIVDGVIREGPDGNLHGVGQLICHLAVVDLHYVYRIKGEPVPEELKDVYGTKLDSNG